MWASMRRLGVAALGILMRGTMIEAGATDCESADAFLFSIPTPFRDTDTLVYAGRTVLRLDCKHMIGPEITSPFPGSRC
jgi:hypothetical protein